MFFKVSMHVKKDDPKILSGSLNLNDLQIEDLPNGNKLGSGRVLLHQEDKVYANVFLWSYWDSDDTVLWHEVFISNSSIERAAGYYKADYKIEISPPLGKKLEGKREDAEFFDGTGYLEVFNEPQYAEYPEAYEFYNRYFPKNTKPIEEAAKAYSSSKQLDAFPHQEWDALDWSQTDFDTAKNTHQTGSPRNLGHNWREGTFLSVVGRLKEKEVQSKLTKYIYGFIGQQSRRPCNFIHDETGLPFNVTENPGLVMGEYGPSNLWNATVFWGRDKFSTEEAKKGKWNGWDLEHFTIDQLIVGYLFYGSQFCLLQIRLLLQCLLSHPHLSTIKHVSNRTWGWNLKALAWGLYIDTYPFEKNQYSQAIQVLLNSYQHHMSYSPIAYAFKQMADGRHLYPRGDQMLKWYSAFGLTLPEDDETYQSLKEAFNNDPESNERKLSEFLVSHAYKQYGYEELHKILDFWSFVACFHIGAAAAGLNLLNDVSPYGEPQAYTIGRHMILCLARYARNSEGTFWYDYGCSNLFAVGNGTDKNGVVWWVAGGLGMLYNLVPIKRRAEVEEGVDSVYLNNDKINPSSDVFYSWFLPSAYHLGYPDERENEN